VGFVNKLACRAALVSAAMLLYAAGNAVVAYGGDGPLFSFYEYVETRSFTFPASYPYAAEDTAPESLDAPDNIVDKKNVRIDDFHSMFPGLIRG
jgi:hypothetical protein